VCAYVYRWLWLTPHLFQCSSCWIQNSRIYPQKNTWSVFWNSLQSNDILQTLIHIFYRSVQGILQSSRNTPTDCRCHYRTRICFSYLPQHINRWSSGCDHTGDPNGRDHTCDPTDVTTHAIQRTWSPLDSNQKTASDLERTSRIGSDRIGWTQSLVAMLPLRLRQTLSAKIHGHLMKQFLYHLTFLGDDGPRGHCTSCQLLLSAAHANESMIGSWINHVAPTSE